MMTNGTAWTKTEVYLAYQAFLLNSSFTALKFLRGSSDDYVTSSVFLKQSSWLIQGNLPMMKPDLMTTNFRFINIFWEFCSWSD